MGKGKNMNKFRFAICLVGIILLVSGCAGTMKIAPYQGSISINDTEMDRSEYVILQNVTGSAHSTYILAGIIENTEDGLRILGFGPSRKTALLSAYSGLMALMPGGQYSVGNRAYYDALTQVPDADTVLPMTRTEEHWGLPPIIYGRSATVTGKAMKIKTDKELR